MKGVLKTGMVEWYVVQEQHSLARSLSLSLISPSRFCSKLQISFIIFYLSAPLSKSLYLSLSLHTHIFEAQISKKGFEHFPEKKKEKKKSPFSKIPQVSEKEGRKKGERKWEFVESDVSHMR